MVTVKVMIEAAPVFAEPATAVAYGGAAAGTRIRTRAPGAAAHSEGGATWVWRRDGGGCCYRDPLTGVTCGATHLVQIDHIVPVAQGGTADLVDLRLRCMAHNRRRDPRCASYRSAPAA